jgi:hypothetical protein
MRKQQTNQPTTYPMGGGVGNGLSKPFLPNNQYVFILPLPFISIGPRDSIM